MTTTQHAVINGIDTAAVRGLIDSVASDSCNGIAGFRVTSDWTGGARIENRVTAWSFDGRELPRDFTIISDEPAELAGNATSANPQEILMAGLNSCMAVGYVVGAALKGITLESLQIESRGELDLRGFLGIDEKVKPGYDRIRYTVRIKGNGTPEQFEEIHRTVQATSPNYYNLSRAIRLEANLVVE